MWACAESQKSKNRAWAFIYFFAYGEEDKAHPRHPYKDIPLLGAHDGWHFIQWCLFSDPICDSFPPQCSWILHLILAKTNSDSFMNPPT